MALERLEVVKLSGAGGVGAKERLSAAYSATLGRRKSKVPVP